MIAYFTGWTTDMLIFYIQDSNQVNPAVIIDSMSSDDRFSKKQIAAAVKANAQPAKSKLGTTNIFSCEYSMQFDHIGMPLGEALKTRFTGMLKSPSAACVKAFTPTFINSSLAVSLIANPDDPIPNPQTRITYATMVAPSSTGTSVVRNFILYSAVLTPDPYGATTTMVLKGSQIEDVFVSSLKTIQLDKNSALRDQIDAFLASQDPAMTGNWDHCPQATDYPATNMLIQPGKLRDILCAIGMQNKFIPIINDTTVTFYGEGQKNAPKSVNYTPPKFSFLGSNGALAWGLGIENYTNVKFKTIIFDCQLLGLITLYNDIKSSFFDGLSKNKSTAVSTALKKQYDTYNAWIIRYSIRWNRSEAICEVTASNDWLMGQFRLDGLLESSVYAQAAANS